MSSKVRVISEHILRLLEEHRSSYRVAIGASPLPIPPLFIALQGPQGIGKTTLTNLLARSLSSASPTNASVPESATAAASYSSDNAHLLILSLDDFYLPHAQMTELSARSGNILLSGRGPPGTHDVPLLRKVLDGLRSINDPSAIPSIASGHTYTSSPRTVNIPRYDKSAFDGAGDRKTEQEEIAGPIDVVLLEGWCMGFNPIPGDELRAAWDQLSEDVSPMDGLPCQRRPEEMLARDVIRSLGFGFSDVAELKDHLMGYVEAVYPFFTGGFIQLAPPADKPYSLIYKWRLEQEHSMKEKNGGRGMTDEQVKRFIDRYIPSYVFFGDYLPAEAPWAGRGIKVTLDENREMQEVSHF